MSFLTVEAAAKDIKVHTVTINCHIGLDPESNLYQAIQTVLAVAQLDTASDSGVPSNASSNTVVLSYKANSSSRSFDFTINSRDPLLVDSYSSEQAVLDWLNTKLRETAGSKAEEKEKKPKPVQKQLAMDKSGIKDIRTSATYICTILLDVVDDVEQRATDIDTFQRINTSKANRGDTSIDILQEDRPSNEITVSVAAKSAQNAEDKIRERLYDGKINTSYGTQRSEVSDKLKYEQKDWRKKSEPRTLNDKVSTDNKLTMDLANIFDNQPKFLTSFATAWNTTLVRIEEFIRKIANQEPIKTTADTYGHEIHAKASNLSYIAQKAIAYDEAAKDVMFKYIIKDYTDLEHSPFIKDAQKGLDIRKQYADLTSEYHKKLTAAKTNKELKNMQDDASTIKREYDAAVAKLKSQAVELFSESHSPANDISAILTKIAQTAVENDDKAGNVPTYYSPTEEQRKEINSSFRDVQSAFSKAERKFISMQRGKFEQEEGKPSFDEDSLLKQAPFTVDPDTLKRVTQFLGVTDADLTGKTWDDVKNALSSKYAELTRDELDKGYGAPAEGKGHKVPSVDDAPLSAINIDNDGKQVSVYVPLHDGATFAIGVRDLANKVEKISRRSGVEGTYNDLDNLLFTKTPEGEEQSPSTFYESIVSFIKGGLELEGVNESTTLAALNQFDHTCKNSTKPTDNDIKKAIDTITDQVDRARAYSNVYGAVDEFSVANSGSIPPLLFHRINTPGATPEERIATIRRILSELSEHYAKLMDKYPKSTDPDEKEKKIPASATSVFESEEGTTTIKDRLFLDNYSTWVSNLNQAIQDEQDKLAGKAPARDKYPVLDATKNSPDFKGKETEDKIKAEIYSNYADTLEPLQEFIDKYADMNPADVDKAAFDNDYRDFRLHAVRAVRLDFEYKTAQQLITEKVREYLKQAEELKNKFENVQTDNEIRDPDQGVADTRNTPEKSEVTPGQAADVIQTTKTPEEK